MEKEIGKGNDAGHYRKKKGSQQMGVFVGEKNRIAVAEERVIGERTILLGLHLLTSSRFYREGKGPSIVLTMSPETVNGNWGGLRQKFLDADVLSAMRSLTGRAARPLRLPFHFRRKQKSLHA
jgi:hypothetical protein